MEASLYDIWRIERALWTEGSDVRRRHVDPDALCVMPEPFGILSGEAEYGRLDRISPYQAVEFSERAHHRTRHCVVVAYRADAIHRTTFATYSALCSSTYAWEGGELRLIAHQHTALPDGGTSDAPPS